MLHLKKSQFLNSRTATKNDRTYDGRLDFATLNLVTIAVVRLLSASPVKPKNALFYTEIYIELICYESYEWKSEFC